MNGFLLLIPFLLVRFSLLSALDKGAIKRAAHFAPMVGHEVYAYWLYQVSNVAIFVYLCFLHIKIDFSWLSNIGLLLYVVGLIMLSITIIHFTKPTKEGFNEFGVYRISRNPMYVSYFLFFWGCALLTQSLMLCGIVILFQITSHWIILAEERWCADQFQDTYFAYMKKVRRYL